MAANTPRLGTLRVRDTAQPCEIVAETPQRYRVRAPKGGELRIPKRGDWLTIIYHPGTTLVPKSQVEIS